MGEFLRAEGLSVAVHGTILQSRKTDTRNVQYCSIPRLVGYHADHYGAFVLDPDGHNIEACCHHPEP
jgi:hypothetical protein